MQVKDIFSNYQVLMIDFMKFKKDESISFPFLLYFIITYVFLLSLIIKNSKSFQLFIYNADSEKSILL